MEKRRSPLQNTTQVTAQRKGKYSESWTVWMEEFSEYYFLQSLEDEGHEEKQIKHREEGSKHG